MEDFRLVWVTDYGTITQGWNENPDRYEKYFGKGIGHEGLDIKAILYSNIYAAADGRVSTVVSGIPLNTVGNKGNYGNQVRIQHRDGYLTIYAHLAEPLVAVGDMVVAGQVIGKADSTGYSTGNHLHFSLKREGATLRGETKHPYDLIDPTPFMLPFGGPMPEGIKAYITAIPYLNVRSGKSTAAPILGTVPYDAAVTLLEPTTDVPLIGVAGEWIKVLTDKGLIGYCAAGYLRLETPIVSRAIGWDFSHHQTVLVTEQQWKDSGSAFLIARASYSLTGGPGMKKDASYLPHIASARAAKLLVGAYHYLTRFESGAAQARFFVEAANAAGELDLPLWADVEDAGLTATIVREFCEECDRLTNGVTGVYTRRSFWEPVIGHNLAWAAHRPLWIAQYPATYSDASNPSALPDTWAAGNWTIWQFAVKRTNFYATNVDHNVYNGNNHDLWMRWGVKPVPVPTLEERVASLESRVGALEAKFNIV